MTLHNFLHLRNYDNKLRLNRKKGRCDLVNIENCVCFPIRVDRIWHQERRTFICRSCSRKIFSVFKHLKQVFSTLENNVKTPCLY